MLSEEMFQCLQLHMLHYWEPVGVDTWHRTLPQLYLHHLVKLLMSSISIKKNYQKYIHRTILVHYLHGHHTHRRTMSYHLDQELQHASKIKRVNNQERWDQCGKQKPKLLEVSYDDQHGGFKDQVWLTASSMVARQPCIEDKPYLTLSFSPSSDNLSVLGELRYVPISFCQEVKDWTNQNITRS